MANLFDALKTYRPRRVIQSDDFNDLSGAIKASFQKLGDAPASGENGVSTAFTVGTPTLTNHATTKTYVDGILGSATNAATSATNAATSATNAETAKTAAETAKTGAETAQAASETAKTGAETAQAASETAKTGAETAKTGAETAKTGAETAKAGAETAETGAETAKTAAETAKAGAETAETNASSSATASASSATASASSAAAAAASYDAFDDRYLGSKTSDPATDNDGNALVTGSLFYNSSTNLMRVYGGSSWSNVAPTATSVTISQISDFPTQTDNAGKYLKTDGSATSWGTVSSGSSASGFAEADTSATNYSVTNAYEVLPSDTTLSGTWELFSDNILHVVEPTSINSTGDNFTEASQTLTGSHVFYKTGTLATYATLTVSSGVILQGVGEAPAPGESSSGTVDTFRSYGELLYFANAA